MPKPIIEVNHLSKRYTIGAKQPYYSLRDTLASIAKNPIVSINKYRREKNKEFWALKDISFQVMPGEVFGIIGRNGAGKSTLLKILTRITPPTDGKITLRGRTSSLLEVGTGFHPELTGRENIYLNGAILGMTRREIKQKFKEIVDFAELEEFLDTPVKHYSSGMYMRLAFSVAAHLEPEILLVDEVLAVGDVQFQKKCLGKMSDVAKQGRTILFVSHNMSAIQNLCNKTILLEDGKVISMGESNQVVKKYLSKQLINKISTQKEIDGINLIKISFKDKDAKETNIIRTFDEIFITCVYNSLKEFRDVSFAVCFNDVTNNRITSLWSEFFGKNYNIKTGKFTITYNIPSFSLIPGIYDVITYIESKGKVVERIDNVKRIHVAFTNKFGLVTEPKPVHGTYIEKFSFQLRQ